MGVLRVIEQPAAAPGRSGKPLAVFVLFNNVLSLLLLLISWPSSRSACAICRSPSFKSKNFQLPNSTTAGAGDDEQSGGISAGNEWDGERARDGWCGVVYRSHQIRLHLASLHCFPQKLSISESKLVTFCETPLKCIWFKANQRGYVNDGICIT